MCHVPMLLFNHKLPYTFLCHSLANFSYLYVCVNNVCYIEANWRSHLPHFVVWHSRI